MKIFANNIEIQPIPPITSRSAADRKKHSAAGLEIKLLNFSPPEFDLVFDTPAEAVAAIEALERFIFAKARSKFRLSGDSKPERRTLWAF